MSFKSVSFYLAHPNKERSSIYLRASCEGEKVQVATGLTIETKYWNTRKSFPKTQLSNYNEYKEILSRIEKKAIAYYWEEKAKGKHVSAKMIKEYVKSIRSEKPKENESLSFFEVFDKYIDYCKKDKRNPNSIMS